jgi:hypothetical protein
MINLANYLSGPSGDFWGFMGIALAYICTGVTELVGENKKNRHNLLWFGPGIIFIILAVSSLIYGTIKVVDAGKVLGYLGIGTGLYCTAWTMHADKVNDRVKWVVQWIIMIVGLLFTLGAAIMMRPAGLVTFNALITLIALILVISVFGLLIYWIIEKLINLR